MVARSEGDSLLVSSGVDKFVRESGVEYSTGFAAISLVSTIVVSIPFCWIGEFSRFILKSNLDHLLDQAGFPKQSNKCVIRQKAKGKNSVPYFYLYLRRSS